MRKLIFISIVVCSWTSSYAYVPEKAFTFDFNVRTINFSRNKEEKLNRAVDLVRKVFASEEFHRRILNHRYEGRRKFLFNNGKSNSRVYDSIMGGAEKLLPWQNNAMDLEVELYTNNDSRVIGFTRPNTKRIWVNTKYFNANPVHKVAANLVHEWLHKLGYGHEFNDCPDRKYSVPYAIGNIVNDIAKKMKD